MSRIKEFRFNWTDAWNYTDKGIDTVIELAPNNLVRICAIVNGKPISKTIDEDNFINALEAIDVIDWNNKVYSRDSEDGYTFRFTIKYDDVEISCCGFNGYPSNFIEFLQILKDLGLPKISLSKYLSEKVIAKTRINQTDGSAYTTYADYVLLKKYYN